MDDKRINALKRLTAKLGCRVTAATTVHPDGKLSNVAYEHKPQDHRTPARKHWSSDSIEDAIDGFMLQCKDTE